MDLCQKLIMVRSRIWVAIHNQCITLLDLASYLFKLPLCLGYLMEFNKQIAGSCLFTDAA
jgi:hypothetical protein